MAEQSELNYEQEIILEADARGALRTARQFLRDSLEDRFGAIPPALEARIDAAELDQLRMASRQVWRLNSLDELPL